MAAGRFFGKPQANNPLVTGVLVFILFLAGVWFVTSPSKNVALNYENDAEIQALKAGAARASLSIEQAATLDRSSSAEDEALAAIQTITPIDGSSSDLESPLRSVSTEETLRVKEPTVQDELDAAKVVVSAFGSGSHKEERTEEEVPASEASAEAEDLDKEDGEEKGSAGGATKKTEAEPLPDVSTGEEDLKASEKIESSASEEEEMRTSEVDDEEKSGEREERTLATKSIRRSSKSSRVTEDETPEKKDERKSRSKSRKSKRTVVEDVDTEEPTKVEAEGAIAMETEADDSVASFSLCKDVGDDYIPCLDNHEAISKLRSTARYEHRERHCPTEEQKKKCLVPMPEGYQPHIKWPESRDQIWYSNVPRPSLANYKADQNWVKAEGDKFVFPGGGTQFKQGATQYIEWLDDSCDELKLGDHLVLGFDVGCGVASFGAYLEPFGVRMMSMAPKDEHEAQIQFALERGVSAVVGVMGTMRQPYPANVYDAVHCARCRVPWYKDGGMLLAEVNRLIRPGGYFIWSATPLCLDCKAKEKDDKEVWEAMSKLTQDMCWNMIVKKVHKENGVAVAVYQKPVDNECYLSRPEGTIPPMCPEDDDADAAWYTPMNACLHKVPLASEGKHGSVWPAAGHSRQREMPAWLPSFGKGLFGKNAEEEFGKDTEHYENVMRKYLDRKRTPVDWSTVRNIMDMDAHYGSFGASLVRQRAWSMNVIPVSRPNTLPVIFDRGLLGVYHDWCEAFNTYPRTYDLLHSDHLLGHIMDTKRCPVEDVLLEMDRILRPKGYIIIREDRNKTTKLQSLAKALHWTELKSADEADVALLVYQKGMWRPSATK